MNNFIEYFLTGLAIGSTLSLMPTPIVALLVNETLKYGKAEGIKISIAPSLIDIPIVTLSLLIISRLSKLNVAFAIISFLGFLFLSYLGIKGFFAKGIKPNTAHLKPQTIKKGLIANLLNPNAYIFWFTVGSPILINAWKLKPILSVVYLVPFYASVIGIRIILAFIIEKFKTILNSNGYLILSKILSLILFLFAVKLLIQGIKLIIS